MSPVRDALVAAAGAVVAVLLEVVLAPAITLFGAQPNFLLAYALGLSVARPERSGAALPFVLGLLYDLLGTGPVGGMALLLVAVCALSSRVFLYLDNSSPLASIAFLVLGSLAVEALYGALLLALGLPAGVGEAFVYRVLPCTLYDSAVALLVYPLLARLFAPPTRTGEPGSVKLR